MARTTASGMIDDADLRQEQMNQPGPAAGLNLATDGAYIPPGIPADGITLDKATASVKVGDTLQFTATVTPEDTTETQVTWKSNNETVGTVSDTGLLTTHAAGQVVVSAYTVNETYDALCVVTVTE